MPVAPRGRRVRCAGMSRLARLVPFLVALVLLVPTTACNPQVDGPAGQPALTKQVVFWGLDHPWDIGFTPRGHMLVTERSGALSLIYYAKGVLYRPPDVVVSGEGGMLGLAVDPYFEANRYVYVCFASNAGPRTDVRLVRLGIKPDWSGITSRTDLVTGMPWNGGRHSGCRPRFGPDGYLYVGTGDAATPGTSQDPWSYGGKVLRIDRNGNAVPGNYWGQLFSYGHRNVQGLAFEPLTNRVISVEHGPNRDDEINVNVNGGNSGWYAGTTYEDASANMNDYRRYPALVPPIWTSGYPTIAPSGATFVVGGQWRSWNGVLAVAVLKGKALMFVFAHGGGGVHDVVYRLQEGYRLRSAVQGPDGSLYVTTDDSGLRGQIWRITPS